MIPLFRARAGIARAIVVTDISIFVQKIYIYSFSSIALPNERIPMHCNQCGTIVPADRTECPICHQRISAPGSDFSQTFGKPGSGPKSQLRLVEPPPKRPSSIRTGIVLAIIGAVILIIGAVLAISIPYVVSDGGPSELKDWAEPSQREVGQTITLYLTISHKNDTKGEYTYEFEGSGDVVVAAYEDIGDPGDSVVVKLRWSETGGAEVTTSHSSWYYRMPGIITCILAITVITIGLVMFTTSRNRYNKQLDEYRRSFSITPTTIPAQSNSQSPPTRQPPQGAQQQPYGAPPSVGAQATPVPSAAGPPPLQTVQPAMNPPGQGIPAPQQNPPAPPPA